MGFVQRVQRWIRGNEPTLVDYETYDQSVAQNQNPPAETTADPQPDGPNPYVVAKVGPGSTSNNSTPGLNAPGTYKMQQSYDALIQTAQELRAALDGEPRRLNELRERLDTLPFAAEALPQASKMQADMLKMINERLALHADQQRKIQEVVTAVGGSPSGAGGIKKEYGEALQSIREQIEMGNEIDRQLVESFNRFSMMIDRLQLANHQAVDALQQVRDSYAASAMQMHEWIEKSRSRSGWLIGGAFVMAGSALAVSLLLLLRYAGH